MNGKLQRAIVAILLAAAVAVVFLRARNYGFVIIADSEHPTNAAITGGLSWNTISWAFTHRVAGNWYPLTMLSHAMDQQFYGSQPGGHHLTNIVLHMANTVLLFCLLLRMLPVPKGWKSNLWPSAVIAALFGLHPLRVESVAWVAERKDVLSGFFFLLTLLAYVRYSEARNARERMPEKVQEHTAAAQGVEVASVTTSTPADLEIGDTGVSEARDTTETSDTKPAGSGVGKWYLITLLTFGLGLLSKPMLVTTPCLFLLLDLWPLNRFTKDAISSVRGLVLEKIPFFVLSAVFSRITFITQSRDSLVVDFATLPLKARLENSVVSYARYIGKTLWPKSLAAYYPMETWQMSQVALAAVLFFGISILALLMVRRRPWMFVGWFWFAGLLFPVIGISQVAMQSMADRFTYLPQIGLFILAVWAVLQLPAQTARAGLSVFCVAALALAGVSVHQLRYWEDSETLFRRIIAVTPENDITQYFMGLSLLEKRDATGAKYYFERTLALNPKYSGAHMRLGDILRAQGRVDEAEQKYRDAINAEPNATICHLKLAKLLAQKRSVDEAIVHYRVALKNRPEIAQAQYELGQLLNEKRDVAGAISAFQEAVRAKPDMIDALNDLAWALATQPDAKLRDGAQAVEFARRAAELTHRAPNVLDTLAAAYAEAGRFDDAVATMRDAIQKTPGVSNGEMEAHLKLYQAKQPFREQQNF